MNKTVMLTTEMRLRASDPTILEADLLRLLASLELGWHLERLEASGVDVSAFTGRGLDRESIIITEVSRTSHVKYTIAGQYVLKAKVSA